MVRDMKTCETAEQKPPEVPGAENIQNAECGEKRQRIYCVSSEK